MAERSHHYHLCCQLWKAKVSFSNRLPMVQHLLLELLMRMCSSWELPMAEKSHHHRLCCQLWKAKVSFSNQLPMVQHLLWELLMRMCSSWELPMAERQNHLRFGQSCGFEEVEASSNRLP